MTLLSFLFVTGLVAAITWYLTRGDDHASSDGYFLAGRTLTGGYIAGSLMLTNLSTEQLVGLNGSAFNDGFSVMAWEVLSGFSLAIMALFFLPRFLRSGIATVPDFLGQRYGTSTRTFATFIFVAAYALILLPIILYTGARGLSSMLDVQGLLGVGSDTAALWITVWGVGILGSVYAIFGGLRTVAISDTLNGFGLLVGGILVTIFGLLAVSGEGGSILDGWQKLNEANPERMNSIGGNDQEVPFHTIFSGVLLLVMFYWTTNQQIIQRALGAKNLAEGQKGVLFAGFLKLLAPLILVFPGMIAFHLYASEGIESSKAYGLLVSRTLPTALVGFFAAVMVGAILSSFNSALNATATLYSLGVYKTIVNPNADHKKVVASGKTAGIIIALFAMTTAPILAGQDSIFGYLQAMNGIYFIPLLAVVLVGFFNKTASQKAANIGLIYSLVMMLLGSFVFDGFIKEILGEKSGGFHYMMIVFITTILLILICGKAMPRSEPYVTTDSGAVDMTPWKHRKLAAGILIAGVVAIYLAFADFSVLD